MGGVSAIELINASTSSEGKRELTIEDITVAYLRVFVKNKEEQNNEIEIVEFHRNRGRSEQKGS